MDFRAWNTGTVELTLEQEAAHLRLCHAMYDVGGPVPSSARFLMSIFRCGNAKAAGLVRQLVKAGKIQRSSDGMLSNRRVTAELSNRERLSDTRRQAGERGGRARQTERETKSSEGRVTPECPLSDPRVTPECGSIDPRLALGNSLKTNEKGKPNASTSRSRGEEIREDTPTAPKGADPEGFTEFKAVYPKRNTAFPATQARKRWVEACRKGATPAEIIAGAKAYAAEQTRIGKVGTEYVQTADVWLNRQRWPDYLDAEPLPQLKLSAPVTDETWRERMRSWRARGGYWPWRPCPPPDDPRTTVPNHILDEFEIPIRAGVRSDALMEAAE